MFRAQSIADYCQNESWEEVGITLTFILCKTIDKCFFVYITLIFILCNKK